MLNPCIVCVSCRRQTIFPAFIILQLILIPRMIIKWWICKDKICLQCWMQIICKGIRIVWTKISVNSTNCHIHLRHFPSIWICFLSVYWNISSFSAVCLNKFFTLNKHTTRPTTTVIHTAIIKWAQNRNQCLNNARWRVELTTANTFLLCKLSNTILICATQKIFTRFCITHINIVGKNINYITQNSFVQIWTCVILRQYIL